MQDPRRYENASKKARRLLITNAIENIEYVAYGKVMKRDLAAEFGITEQEADNQGTDE